MGVFYQGARVMSKLISNLALSIVFLLSLCGAAFSQDSGGQQVAGIRVAWQAPKYVQSANISGYNIYRSEDIMGHYTKLNDAFLKGLSYDDTGLVKGKQYYYKVTTVFAGGSESKATDPVGMDAGAKAGTPENTLPHIETFTSDALGSTKYLDDEASFVLSGDAGMTVTFKIDGVADNLTMTEMQPGSYKGVFKVTSGLKVRNTYAEATATNASGGKSIKSTAAEMSFLGSKKPSLTGLYAGVVESDRVGLNWPKSADTDGCYKLYRDTARIVGLDGMKPVSGNIAKEAAAYIDVGVSPGTKYYYVLASYDGSGGLVAFTENLTVSVPVEGHVSGIDVVDEDSGGKVLVPGDVLNVSMKTSPGGKAYFTLGTAVREKAMNESESGLYKCSYTVREGDGVLKSRISVSFRDAEGKTHFSNSATFVSLNAPKSGTGMATGRKPQVYNVTDDIQSVEGISGKLTAGKTFTVTLTGEAGNEGFFDVGDGIWKVSMTEDAGNPGVYKGQYTVRPGDSAGMSPDPLKKVYVTGYLESREGVMSDHVSGPVPVVIDTTCDIKVDVSANTLPADARSQAKVTFTVTDADGQPVKDRRLSVVLEPPPHYTGVVGGGGYAQSDATTGNTNIGTSTLGRLDVDFDDMSDSFGKVTATYTSGFAAKTAMIVARDFLTGSVGMNYITTSIKSSVSVTLTAGGAAVTAPTVPIYQLVIDAVPDPANPINTYAGFTLAAVPDTLTADGVSRANIIATLTQNGSPVQGKTILFAVSGAGGSLTASSAVTDSAGRAQVFYIAGTKAGKAMVTATEPSTGITATKIITLLADAPAKILVKTYPDTMPADGISTSLVVVEVADVNNNPTDNVEIGFALRGVPENGAISAKSATTDSRGACQFNYTAGTTPGVATVDITAVSAAPTADQLAAAVSRVVSPLVYDNNDYSELTVQKWYKAAGDRVGKGEPLALVGTPLGDMVVYSPVTGTLDSITVDQGINVMEGKEIGIMK